MKYERRREFCTECRHETEYALKSKMISKTIKGQEYNFLITSAICTECGSEMSLPGLTDKNIKEIDEQYRKREGLVCIEDIENLLEIYNIGKAPASCALGFGKITIARYLLGQLPSKEYSDVIKAALASPIFMKAQLINNREKVGEVAFNKAFEAATSLQNLFSISDKMLSVTAYIFATLKEVAPLMLQKLLYYIQGIYIVLCDQPLFSEDCRAWNHGPVYEEVFDLLKEFKYNPIEDARFAVFKGKEEELTDDERGVIELVLKTFGMYSGKTLEKITHKEEPWIIARKGYDDEIPSHEIILKENLKKYFMSVNEKYSIGTEKGLRDYISKMLQ